MKSNQRNHLQRQGFELKETIGSGLSGNTVKAIQSSLNRYVAVKFFDSDLVRGDNNLKRRFMRESKILAELYHPSIPYILTNGEVQDSDGVIPYYVMQYIKGETLEEYARTHSITLEEVLNIANQILEALIFIHDKGVIHRDIKPSNIMITPSGHCFLIDFSIGFKENESTGFTRVTQSGEHLGSYQYMSPEQAKDMKTVDKRSDLYSFSIVLCELLTGKPDIASLDDSEIPHVNYLRKIIRKGSHHEVVSRFSSASEYKRELNQLTTSVLPIRENPSKAVCANIDCTAANWSPNGYYRGPRFIEESTDAYCTDCGSKLIYQCDKCGSPVSNTQFCGGCGAAQFSVPECMQCGSLLTKQDMHANTKDHGCVKCRRKKKAQENAAMSSEVEFDDDIPF
ncbi:MAG: serine/threonine-protein kinase [Candidatus Thiodiazotropha taylori]